MKIAKFEDRREANGFILALIALKVKHTGPTFKVNGWCWQVEYDDLPLSHADDLATSGNWVKDSD